MPNQSSEQSLIYLGWGNPKSTPKCTMLMSSEESKMVFCGSLKIFYLESVVVTFNRTFLSPAKEDFHYLPGGLS